jgi:hypothetical protein|uniref:Uncharacterized protein n=1 Tax=Podoviridae sp. ctBev14 TaxID=2823556 RepID=A0A8S5LAT1_9CAUD|nr:MAG TPA: hypothetical protein [Podoviridae sp. ctBev14]
MEKLTLKRFIFNEVLSLRLIEQTNSQGTIWTVFVDTLNDDQEEENVVFEEQTANKDSAETVFQNKYNCLLGLVE